MPKIRVGQLVKELNLKAGDVIELLRKMGAEVKNNLSTVAEAFAVRVRGSASSGTVVPSVTAKPKARVTRPSAATTTGAKAPVVITANRGEAAPPDRPAVVTSTQKPRTQPPAPGRIPPAQTERGSTIARSPAARAPAQIQNRPTAAVPQARQAPAPRPSQPGGPVPLRPGPSPTSTIRPATPIARPGVAGAKPVPAPLTRPHTGVVPGRPVAARPTPGLGVHRPTTGQGFARPNPPAPGQPPRPGVAPSRPGGAAAPQMGRPQAPAGIRPPTGARPIPPAAGPRPAPPQVPRRPGTQPTGQVARAARPEPAMPPH